jgi:hypothetical protein
VNEIFAIGDLLDVYNQYDRKQEQAIEVLILWKNRTVSKNEKNI